MSDSTADPFEQLEMIADEIEVIAMALGAIEGLAGSKIGQMLGRTAARMQEALTLAQNTYEAGVKAKESA